MEDESTRLTAEERRIFAEIEASLRGSERRSLRDRLRPPSPWMRRMAAVAALLGTALLAGGLWFGSVAVAGAGFVVLLTGLSRLVAEGVAGRMLRRARRWFERIASPGDTS